MGRFDNDPAYQERLKELEREMPRHNARVVAGREFSGASRPRVWRSPATERQVAAMEAFVKAMK